MTALVKESGRSADQGRVASLASAPARLAGSAVLALQSDDRLVALVRDGHERAFEVLVDRYRRPLLCFCGRILPESRTEDAVQQAFINAHAALARSDEAVEFKPWIYMIARNASLNMLRQNGWNYDQIPLDLDGVRRPEQVVEQRIELQTTIAAVNDLPERQRTALVMRELEGRSYTEIGLVLGSGDGAVRQLLNRARGTLRAAATMLTPPPLLLRVASNFPGDGSRVTRATEVLGGLSAAGVAKVGATALVAGTLVVGAVKAPLPVIGHHHGATRQSATLGSRSDGAKAKAVDTAAPIGSTSQGSTRTPRHGGRGRRAHGRNGDGGHRDGAVPGSGGENHSGSRNTGDDHSGGGGSGTREHATRDDSGSDDHSGRGTSGSPGSGSSGSDDSGDAVSSGADPAPPDDTPSGTPDTSGSAPPISNELPDPSETPAASLPPADG